MKLQNSFQSTNTGLGVFKLVRVMIVLLLFMVSSCSSLRKGAGDSPWPSSTPEMQGMESDKLLNMLSYIEESQFNLHSLLIFRHGTLVLEAYFPPFGPQDKHMLFSTTKSFTSALVGIALEEGKIKSVDQPVVEIFPNEPIENLDERKRAIRLQDLLNMTSGLTTNDIEMNESQDWAQFALNQPMAAKPGTKFDYNTGNTQLLSAIIQKTSGVTTSAYAKEKLFEPLEIRDYYWPADPGGTTQGGIGLMLTPLDMAKFGYLYLHQGEWKGRQIVPAEWVDASTQKNDHGYANQWWQSNNGFYALGYGGQIIYVIPSKDLVVVSTAALPYEKQEIAVTLTDAFIINSIVSDQPLPDSPASKELADRLAAIANPPAQTASVLPATVSSVNNKTFRVDENPLGWKTVKLVFENQQAWMTVTTAAKPEELKFAIGLDGLYRKTAQEQIEGLVVEKPKQRYFLNPYEFHFLLGVPLDGEVAMKGEWTDTNEFSLTVQDTRDFDRETLVFQFTPPDIKIKWKSLMEMDTLLNFTGQVE